MPFIPRLGRRHTSRLFGLVPAPPRPVRCARQRSCRRRPLLGDRIWQPLRDPTCLAGYGLRQRGRLPFTNRVASGGVATAGKPPGRAARSWRGYPSTRCSSLIRFTTSVSPQRDRHAGRTFAVGEAGPRGGPGCSPAPARARCRERLALTRTHTEPIQAGVPYFWSYQLMNPSVDPHWAVIRACTARWSWPGVNCRGRVTGSPQPQPHKGSCEPGSAT